MSTWNFTSRHLGMLIIETWLAGTWPSFIPLISKADYMTQPSQLSLALLETRSCQLLSCICWTILYNLDKQYMLLLFYHSKSTTAQIHKGWKHNILTDCLHYDLKECLLYIANLINVLGYVMFANICMKCNNINSLWRSVSKTLR